MKTRSGNNCDRVRVKRSWLRRANHIGEFIRPGPRNSLSSAELLRHYIQMRAEKYELSCFSVLFVSMRTVEDVLRIIKENSNKIVKIRVALQLKRLVERMHKWGDKRAYLDSVSDQIIKFSPQNIRQVRKIGGCSKLQQIGKKYVIRLNISETGRNMHLLPRTAANIARTGVPVDAAVKILNGHLEDLGFLQQDCDAVIDKNKVGSASRIPGHLSIT